MPFAYITPLAQSYKNGPFPIFPYGDSIDEIIDFFKTSAEQKKAQKI